MSTQMYVVFNTETNARYFARTTGDHVFNLRAAKILASKQTKKTGVRFTFMRAEEFVVLPPKMKTVKNLMTGVVIEIPADTPHCCDPSTETYWSM